MKNGPYELVVAPPDYPGKRYRGRYVYEHHLVWWRHTKQLVGDGYNIHHKNGNKRDNRFENLERVSHRDHARDHGAARRIVAAATCRFCLARFEINASIARTRLKANGNLGLFCSRTCQVKAQWKDRKKKKHPWHSG